MYNITHIINTIHPEENAELYKRQSLTIESMRLAKKFCAQNVSLAAIQYAKIDDRLPQEFDLLPPLERSVQDFIPYTSRKLPLIQEVLLRAKKNVSCDYLIYTNCDIILTPHFYESVAYYLNKGHDALVINRQRVSIALNRTDDLPAIFADKGMIHPGFDCFVFSPDLLQSIDMDTICLGIPFIGVGLAHWVFSLSENPLFMPDANLTRHIGLEVMPPVDSVLYKHNRQAFNRIKKTIPWKENLHKFPYALRPFPNNLWRWGLNPSLSTRDFLEWKMWGWRRKLGFFLNQKRWNQLK
ncbi:MAG TPA: hypothetical protein DEO99_07960 [Bacteroidetes bacterium]|nr:hypothetical protein [Bacteroidota bacterium]|tara:strand:+ start:583 stop:1473 length:891 start_codon:yes stop_codon:yes gene_type:complete